MQITSGKIKSAQKVVVYGPEGIGKSTFASQFPDPVFIDTEGSTKKLDVKRLPNPSSFAMVINEIEYIKSNPESCKTLVIDTADWAEKLCVADVCITAKKDGIEDFGYGKGYTYVYERFGKILNLLDDIIALNINILITAHAMMRKFEQPDEMGSYDRYELKLSKQIAAMLKEWADMVLFVNYKTFIVKEDDKAKKGKGQGGTRTMYTTHRPAWDAKNRDGLPDEVPFEYQSIKHIIEGDEVTPKSEPEPQMKCFMHKTTFEAVKAYTPPTTDYIEVDEEYYNRLREAAKQTTPAVEEPPKTEPKPEPIAETESVPFPELVDLMTQNGVKVEEIKKVVSLRGYYPYGTPVANYDPNFVRGVLVSAWGQVFGMIEQQRQLDEIPFEMNENK